jgi:hypothetical protein
MSSTLVFTAETTKDFAPNWRRGAQYSATIQNLTSVTLTLTVTNQNIQQNTSPTFDVPAIGATTIAAGAIGLVKEPYKGWRLTGASTTGTVEITEAG